MQERFPVVINCRDRLESLAELVAWLERAGQGPILLVDNDSTYPPLLDYYEQTPHEVVRLGQNAGPYAPWTSGVVAERFAGQWYASTDPDIVPGEGCPLDALTFFHDVLQRYPAFPKAGFGLKLDDLPDRYRFAAEVRDWERRFWDDVLEPGLYAAPIDTTFALYRPDVGFQIDIAIRTGEPYVARHTAWYVDSDDPPEEERWYRAHARPEVNSWNHDELPGWLAEAVDRIRLTGDPRPRPARASDLASGSDPARASDLAPASDPARASDLAPASNPAAGPGSGPAAGYGARAGGGARRRLRAWLRR
ncbi:MAG TPA: hypothetical protein VG276_12460 [Actinomycetes bacterium]|nr:hypothetical protein [Actinomycetes bacterium]